MDRSQQFPVGHPPIGDGVSYQKCGDALHSEGRFEEAVGFYRRSLACQPKQADVWYAAGCAEISRKEFASAIECFRNALELNPAWPQAKHNLGRALFELGQTEEAMALFREVAASPLSELPMRAMAVIAPQIPDYDNAAVLETRRLWAEAYLPAQRFNHHRRSEAGPLRVGYLSSFFQRHNWMKPVWGLINQHDRRSIEVHLFSDCPAHDIRHGYCAHAADCFRDISALSNEAAAECIESSRIDVLVDLNGYSSVRRLPLIALRPAPLIVGWFNMYATSGMDCYDYLIGDDCVIPPAEEKFYSEKILRVPGSYLTFETNYPVPPVSQRKRRAITFGCLASQYKITKHVIAAWCEILRQVPASSLILANAALRSEENCRFVSRLFEEKGIAPDRVLLRGGLDHYRFLQIYDEIDIALDTFPYNGGTTTTEAIWQGVPVVTFAGDRWVSRTSASILRAGGLGRFVADGIPGYVSLAVALASEDLAELRGTMRSRLSESSVCDTARFARNMELHYSIQSFLPPR
jgi:protein O-GlcNAc transferase